MLLMTVLVFNHTIAENYINVSNKESLVECYEVIKSVGRNQIFHEALWAVLYLLGRI